MKLIGRIFFGFLVAYIGLNVYALSTFDMQTSYIKKYGEIAVEANDQVFFKSLYDYYIDDNLIEAQLEDSVLEQSFDFYIFQGLAGGRNFLRVQASNVSGYDITNGIVIEFITEALEKNEAQVDVLVEKTFSLSLYQISENFMFGAADLKELREGQQDYFDLVGIKIYALGVKDNDSDGKVLVYEAVDTPILAASDMNLVEQLNTPLDPNANPLIYPEYQSLGLTRGVTHPYFGEFQFILWRNMAIFLGVVGLLTYVLFFRKKKKHAPKTNEIFLKENLNSKVIDHKDN